MIVNSRNNPQIWRIAEWLMSCISSDIWNELKINERDMYYDKTIDLLVKMANNEFTGPDNHED